jgi:hypothetical protein
MIDVQYGFGPKRGKENKIKETITDALQGDANFLK